MRRSAMVTSPIAEFRDPDGSYVLVQPLDEVRCRVLASNVTPKGDVLFKDAELTWQEAAEDLGGYTRLGLEELGPARDELPREDADYRDLVLGERVEAHDPLLEVEDPRYGKAHETDVDGDL